MVSSGTESPNSSCSRMIRSQARHRTTPWAAGMGPSSTIRPKNAGCGLLSYGPDGVDDFRRTATYVDRILRGEKPGDLPVQFPTKYEMVVNRKTAKALGIDVPPALLALADEVIE